MKLDSETRSDRPTAVFGPLADDYAAARPGYPDALFEALWMRVPSHAGRAQLVLDVAAGTGAATAPLVARGARTLALAPTISMLLHARNRLGREPHWLGAVAGRAEALPVATGVADAGVVAQAFHWLDETASLAEIARVLRPRGLLAVLWNIAEEDAFIREVWEVVEAMNPGHKRPVTVEKRRTPEALAAHPAFTVLPPQEFAHVRRLTADEYVRYAFSWSYVGGALGPAERTDFERQLRALFARHHEGVRVERLVAVAHFARRR
ncbi:class I SAM-dependent methyltransferase [soil metagenome]